MEFNKYLYIRKKANGWVFEIQKKHIKHSRYFSKLKGFDLEYVILYRNNFCEEHDIKIQDREPMIQESNVNWFLHIKELDYRQCFPKFDYSREWVENFREKLICENQ
jgi:hypothetical protein